MSLIERFSGNIYGGITFTGNSLMVSERSDPRPLSELSDSCSFITTDTKKKFKDFPEGTCENYESNSSAAPLVLPGDAYVVFSELIWGGTYKTTGGGLPEELLDSKIKFILPNNEEKEIEPDFSTATSLKFSAFDAYSYTRSAIVTDFVRENGSGFYTVGAVPAYFAPGDNISQIFASAGWTLSVIYRRRDTKVPLKNISFYVGAVPVNENESKTQTFSGFTTPKETPQAQVLLSACCGDISEEENTVSFSNNENGNFVPICGPNNLRNHFFASQINNCNGFLETTGTFGTYNHFLVGSDYVGSACGRQGWDITEIDISHLTKEENKNGILKFEAKNDRFMVNAAALCIDTEGEESDFSDKEVLSESVKAVNLESPEAMTLGEVLPENNTPEEPKEEETTIDNTLPKENPTEEEPVLKVSPKVRAENSTIAPERAPILASAPTAAPQQTFAPTPAKFIPNPTFAPINTFTTSTCTCKNQASTPANTPENATGALFSQAMIERLYTYNISEISNYSINYDSARVVNFGKIPVLTAGYTLNLCYIDDCGKKQTSVKRGSVSFMDISLGLIDSCAIRIFPATAIISGNEVIFRASVKVYSV